MLASVTIPSSVTTIGENAFSKTHPTTLIVGSELALENMESSPIEITLMDDYVGSVDFQTYSILKKVVSLPTYPPLAANFSNTQIMDLEVLVPTSALSLYQQALGWKDLWNLKGGAETTTSIENVVVPDKKNKSCIYNINGMRVEHTVPGEIYIKDGKKFIAR